MSKEKLEIISTKLKNYIISNEKVEPYVFLYGEEKRQSVESEDLGI